MTRSKSLEQLVPPTLTDLLDATKLNLSSAINCVEVGIIQSFDLATQTATIQLALKRIVSVEADGTRTIQERPLLLQCPVMVLFGGNSFLSMPIAPGDNCIVLFNDREIDQWFMNGGLQTPATYRMHSISDAIAIVGIRSLQNSISDYLANGIRLSYNSSSRLDLTNAQIESLAALFKQNGDMQITGDLLVEGNTHIEGGLQVDGLCTGNGGGSFKMGAALDMNGFGVSGGVLNSSNGATATYTNSPVARTVEANA